MREQYEPPFHMTEEITNLIVEIGEYTGSVTTYEALHSNRYLGERTGSIPFILLWRSRQIRCPWSR